MSAVSTGTVSQVEQVAARLHRLALGSGENPVVFVHGWSCQASDWAETLEVLAADRSVLALDLPGHGGSADISWDDWTIIGLAQLVVASARHAGVARLTLVGHSMGGVVALEAARLWAAQEGADRLVGVVLVDTFGLPYGDMDAETVAAIETPFRENFTVAMGSLVDNTTAGDLDPDRREWIKQRMASGDPDRMLPLWANLLRWSPDAVFSELACPIWAINGEHIPEAARRRCAPSVETRELVGCHHFPQFERPQVFVRTLSEILRQCAPSQG